MSLIVVPFGSLSPLIARQTGATNLCAGIIVNLEIGLANIESKLQRMKLNFEISLLWIGFILLCQQCLPIIQNNIMLALLLVV